MSYRADKLVIDTHTDTQTHRMTIPEGQNWPRVKTYSPRWFHRTWDGANQSSYCRVIISCKNLGAWQECSGGCDEQMIMPLYIYGPRQSHGTRDGVNWSNSWGVTAPSRKAWSSWWTCCCTPTDQDGTIELEMEPIVFFVVVELQCPQHGQMEEWMEGRMEKWMADTILKSPLHFFRKKETIRHYALDSLAPQILQPSDQLPQWQPLVKITTED